MEVEEETTTCKFYNEGRCRFGENCRHLHVGEIRSTQGPKAKANTKPKTKSDSRESNESKKLPSMRTARDVIQRIQWDPDLPSENFTIGYLDRFVGIVEQPFDLFDWTSDLASVDQNVLAIPEHRIQYFKYRGKKVWDKVNRLDMIFGSTSSATVDVATLLQSVDEDLLYKEDTIVEETRENADSDNEPTHFLAIRVDDVDLKRELDCALLKLTEKSTGKINPALLHCTLALLRLDSIDKVAHCTSLLKSIGPDFFLDRPNSVQLQGLSTFRDRVLFSRVCDDARLLSMVTSLIDYLKKNSVEVLERPNEFHISLMKGYKNVVGLTNRRFDEFDGTVFGCQEVNFVHLCALRETPDIDGFYKVLTSVQITRTTSQ